MASVSGLESTEVEGSRRVSFPQGFALSDLRDESVGGQRGVRFAATLLLAVNTNPKFTANDIAILIGEKPHRIAFILDRPLEIPAIFKFAKQHTLGLEGLTNDSVEVSLDSIADSANYKERNWRVLASNASGTGRLELSMAGRQYRAGPAQIEGSVARITPESIQAVLRGSAPLSELIEPPDG